MRKEKEKIILREGSLVEVVDYKNNTIINTHAIIGKAVRLPDSMSSLEARRRGVFLSDVNIKNGNIVKNIASGEQYIVVSIMDEVYKNTLLSKICMLLKCNGFLTVSGDVEYADENGNIKKTAQVKYSNLPVYVDTRTMGLEAVKPGLVEFTKCYIYCCDVSISTLDRLVLNSGERSFSFKVLSTDYVSYPGLVIIFAETETRR